MNITKILTLASLTGMALMGGVFYAFGTAIMGSLQRMLAGQGAAAMNLISARIQNPARAENSVRAGQAACSYSWT
jgi:uncharacterized membrane protein